MNGLTYGEQLAVAHVEVQEALRRAMTGSGSIDRKLAGRRLVLSVAARHLDFIATQHVSTRERQQIEPLRHALAPYRASWETGPHPNGPWLRAARALGVANDILVSHHGTGFPFRSPFAIYGDPGSWRCAVAGTAELVASAASGTAGHWLPERLQITRLAVPAAFAAHPPPAQAGGTAIEQLHVLHVGLPFDDPSHPAESALAAFSEYLRLAHLQTIQPGPTSLGVVRFTAVISAMAFSTVERLAGPDSMSRSLAVDASARRSDLLPLIRKGAGLPNLVRVPADLIDTGLAAKNRAARLEPDLSAAALSDLSDAGQRITATLTALGRKVPSIDRLAAHRTESRRHGWRPGPSTVKPGSQRGLATAP